MAPVRNASAAARRAALIERMKRKGGVEIERRPGRERRPARRPGPSERRVPEWERPLLEGLNASIRSLERIEAEQAARRVPEQQAEREKEAISGQVWEIMRKAGHLPPGEIAMSSRVAWQNREVIRDREGRPYHTGIDAFCRAWRERMLSSHYAHRMSIESAQRTIEKYSAPQGLRWFNPRRWIRGASNRVAVRRLRKDLAFLKGNVEKFERETLVPSLAAINRAFGEYMRTRSAEQFWLTMDSFHFNGRKWPGITREFDRANRELALRVMGKGRAKRTAWVLRHLGQPPNPIAVSLFGSMRLNPFTKRRGKIAARLENEVKRYASGGTALSDALNEMVGRGRERLAERGQEALQRWAAGEGGAEEGATREAGEREEVGAGAEAG